MFSGSIGVQHFPGVHLFPGGGGGGVGRGIKMLILKETNRTCDFQGGSDPCPLC